MPRSARGPSSAAGGSSAAAAHHGDGASAALEAGNVQPTDDEVDALFAALASLSPKMASAKAKRVREQEAQEELKRRCDELEAAAASKDARIAQLEDLVQEITGRSRIIHMEFEKRLDEEQRRWAEKALGLGAEDENDAQKGSGRVAPPPNGRIAARLVGGTQPQHPHTSRSGPSKQQQQRQQHISHLSSGASASPGLGDETQQAPSMSPSQASKGTRALRAESRAVGNARETVLATVATPRQRVQPGGGAGPAATTAPNASRSPASPMQVRPPVTASAHTMSAHTHGSSPSDALSADMPGRTGAARGAVVGGAVGVGKSPGSAVPALSTPASRAPASSFGAGSASARCNASSGQLTSRKASPLPSRESDTPRDSVRTSH